MHLLIVKFYTINNILTRLGLGISTQIHVESLFFKG